MEEKKQDYFIPVLLGIIYDPSTKKILIGRREKDKLVPQLTWIFPGGKAKFDEELEQRLKKTIKEKTNLDVESLGCIFSRVLPEKNNLLMIYYLCEKIGGKEAAQDEFVEIKWVSPEELENHFTTSFHPHLREYVLNLK